MTKPNQTRRKSGRAMFASLRRPAATWFAALAFLVQMISVGAAPAGVSPEQRAAAALSAAIGQEVSLCAQGEHPGAPDQSCPCCGDCALCGLACFGAPALIQRVVALLAPERVTPASFPTEDEAAARPPIFVSAARPRAPPVPA